MRNSGLAGKLPFIGFLIKLLLYRSGRVDVHGVASEEEAIQFIDDIKFIVEGAFVD